MKLVWTIFDDYLHLVYEVEGLDKEESQDNDQLGEKKEEIKKWIERNYKALQELMKE